MTVYVDNYRGILGRMVMCHMMSDASLEELHSMAEKLGLKREWFQQKSAPHYDVCLRLRKTAIALGAIEVSIRSPQWRVVYLAAKALMPKSNVPAQPESPETHGSQSEQWARQLNR